MEFDTYQTINVETLDLNRGPETTINSNKPFKSPIKVPELDINDQKNSLSLSEIALSIEKDGQITNPLFENRLNILGNFSISSLNKFRANIDDATFKEEPFTADYQEAHVINEFADKVAGHLNKIPKSFYKELIWISSMSVQEFRHYRENFSELNKAEKDDYLKFLFGDGKEIATPEKFSRGTFPVPEIKVSKIFQEDSNILDELYDRYDNRLLEYRRIESEINKNLITKMFSRDKKRQLETTKKGLNYLQAVINHRKKINQINQVY
jgi:hypothetical protein